VLEGLSAPEARRKAVHVAVGGFAFLLRVLSWWQAALVAVAGFVFNWLIFPRVGGKSLWRKHEHEAGYAHGVVVYPLAVLALILVFRGEPWMATVVWGVLAFGDGMAALIGMAIGGRRLPWNAEKSWAGSLAFVLFGGVAASVLMAWTLRLPIASWASPRILAVTVPLVLACALVESIPTTLDDNITVPLAGALLVPLLAAADPSSLLERDLPRLAAIGLAVNAALAAAAFAARSIDLAGAISAMAIGTVITIGLGPGALAVMVAFFVLGSTATRVGYRSKAARGIAQERGGARGWRNAWANGGVPALLALLGGMSPAERGLYALAYAASVATAAADTCSSEIGKAFGRRTYLVTSLRPVPAGTEGAVSLEGTTGGLLAAVLIGAAGAAVGLYPWPAAAVVAGAALLGSLGESVMGTVAERRGWMSNDLLNAFNTALGAALAFAAVRLAPSLAAP
jgi:uncharacterized protein (TIGR00297 family)